MQLGWLGRVRFIPLSFVGMIHALPALSLFLFIYVFGFFLWLRGQIQNSLGCFVDICNCIVVRQTRLGNDFESMIYTRITVYLQNKYLFSI